MFCGNSKISLVAYNSYILLSEIFYQSRHNVECEIFYGCSFTIRRSDFHHPKGIVTLPSVGRRAGLQNSQLSELELSSSTFFRLVLTTVGQQVVTGEYRNRAGSIGMNSVASACGNRISSDVPPFKNTQTGCGVSALRFEPLSCFCWSWMCSWLGRPAQVLHGGALLEVLWRLCMAELCIWWLFSVLYWLLELLGSMQVHVCLQASLSLKQTKAVPWGHQLSVEGTCRNYLSRRWWMLLCLSSWAAFSPWEAWIHPQGLWR